MDTPHVITTDMSLQMAAYHTVRSYPGGAVALAPQMLGGAGNPLGSTVLSNKVNPQQTGHRLTLDEADQMVAITGNPLIISAFVARHQALGLTLFQGQLHPEPGDGHLLERVLGMSNAVGVTCQAVNQALADGVLTRDEVAHVRTKAMETVSAVLGMVETLSRMAG